MIRQLMAWVRHKLNPKTPIEQFMEIMDDYSRISRPWNEYQKRLREHSHRNWRAADYYQAARISQMHVEPLHVLNQKMADEAWDEAYSRNLGFPPPADYEGGTV